MQMHHHRRRLYSKERSRGRSCIVHVYAASQAGYASVDDSCCSSGNFQTDACQCHYLTDKSAVGFEVGQPALQRDKLRGVFYCEGKIKFSEGFAIS